MFYNKKLNVDIILRRIWIDLFYNREILMSSIKGVKWVEKMFERIFFCSLVYEL